MSILALENPSEECLASVFKELDTSRERVEQDVQIIRTWLHQQPHLPHIQDDKCIEHMLVRCKCSVERTKQTLEMHFTLKTALPEFFADRDPTTPRMQKSMDRIQIAPLPAINSDGYRVLVVRNVDKDPSTLDSISSIKYHFMQADIRMMEDSSVGDTVLYDFANVTLGFFTAATLPEIKKMEICATKGYRARLKAIHFINCPAAMDVVLMLIKTVVKNKVVNRIHVHPTLESLYKHVDRAILPAEYGGNAASLNTLSAEWKRKTESYRDWFLDQDVVGKADESKRPGKTFNTCDLFGFEGTFKQLITAHEREYPHSMERSGSLFLDLERMAGYKVEPGTPGFVASKKNY